MNEKDQIRMARAFVRARPDAQQTTLGPKNGFRIVWRPTLAGQVVRNVATDPEEGYATRDKALAAAKSFQRDMRGFLERHA